MPKDKIRVAIVGVGNCASALIQGLEFYKALYKCCTAPGQTNAYMQEGLDAFKSGQVAMQMNWFAFFPGLYKEMGLDCCVARSPEEFVEIAVRLAQEPDYRRGVSGQIAARCERLFDRPDAALALGEELMRIAEAAR